MKFSRSVSRGMARVMRFLPAIAVCLSLLLVPGFSAADDGPIFRKNVSATPKLETEFAAIRMLPLYIPPQAANKTVLAGVDYTNAEGAVVETREYVRPLITHYTDGLVTTIEEEGYGGFPGHGKRDAFGAVSLDDGATWKRTNLSKSGDKSSIKIKVGNKWVPYPGDVGRTYAASDGNQVLIVWVSTFCGGGSPAYAMSDEEQALLADYLVEAGAITDAAACTDGDPLTPCTYLEDAFGVSGSQGVQSATDLADEGYPLVGDLPFSCAWAARGVMLPPAEEGGLSTFTWFKAERLSSGVRSANRPEAVCVKGAGCVVTWQEDPEGIRPGEGEGPGEGWSGAVAHHQTDTWYSYIDWVDFGLVADGTYGTFYAETGDLVTWVAENASGAPQAAVPMSVPMRLTDNAMCTADDSAPYCFVDYDGSGVADFCASTVSVTIETPEGPTQDVDMCVAEDGRLMRGNTAATRARLGLHGYSSACAFDRNDPEACPIDSAWFYMAYEENKGLGDEGEDEDTPDDLIDKVDMGKNVWYHTFDMFTPEPVSQGLMLNQPAVYQDDFENPEGFLTAYGDLDYNFYQIDPDPVYETLAGLDTTLLQSEISRRPSVMSQDWYDAGPSGLVGFQLWKQGIIRRGGPADIMARRFVMPDDFDATVDNPYDYTNMVCENADGSSGWAFTDGANPRYVKGLCAAPAINLSSNTILAGETCADATACLDAFPFNDYFDDLEGGTAISKIYEWAQYGEGYGAASLDTTLADDPETSLDDTTWANPYDMAKGHRGFLAGDMVMAMYAWTPNWNALTGGNEIVNLYIRRSFDGGVTWSTLPASFTHTNGITYAGDGTTTCEWMDPAGEEAAVCTTYAAGQFEQARNVSQLLGTQVTVLDPRYSPTTRTINEAWVSTSSLPEGFVAPLYEDDTRDPSRYFMVYETGFTSAYDAGEAEPLDLFYSRAVDWGDDYLVWQDVADTIACLPSAEDEALAGFCNEFDALEGSRLSESGEASVTCSPGGQFFYATWNQWDFDRRGVEIGADAWFRRVLFLDDYIPPLE